MTNVSKDEGGRCGAARTRGPSFETPSFREGPQSEVSPAGHALRVDVQRVERVARRHKQAIAMAPAEAEVGAALGQRDVADRLARRIEDAHAVELVGHAPA